MSSDSSILQSQSLKEDFARFLGRIQRVRKVINGDIALSEIPDFIIRELGEVEFEIQSLAQKIGLDIDMEAKNIREIEAVLAQFIAKNYGDSTEQALHIARHLMTQNQDKEVLLTDAAESAALKAIVTVDVQYKRIDKSSWLRSINIWHLSGGKPARYNAEISIPRDELPPAVREQSLITDQDEFHIRIFPQE